MANTRQAKKRAQKSEENRKHNASFRSMARTYVKRVIAAIRTGNKEQAQQEFLTAQPVIDRVAQKGVIHKNKAARHKSRLAKRINAMSAAS